MDHKQGPPIGKKTAVEISSALCAAREKIEAKAAAGESGIVTMQIHLYSGGIREIKLTDEVVFSGKMLKLSINDVP